MKVIKLRVVPDVEQDIFRDIEIGENQNFEAFYNFIIQTFGFRGDQLASFYLSNEEWDKGHEIALMDMGGPSPDGLPTEMRSAIIGDIIQNSGQKLILVYDFLKMWCFYIEVLSVEEKNEMLGVPEVVMSFGEAPDEDAKEMPDLMEGIDLGGGDSASSGEADYDDILKEFDDIDNLESEGFENIDDLDI